MCVCVCASDFDDVINAPNTCCHRAIILASAQRQRAPFQCVCVCVCVVSACSYGQVQARRTTTPTPTLNDAVEHDALSTSAHTQRPSFANMQKHTSALSNSHVSVVVAAAVVAVVDSWTPAGGWRQIESEAPYPSQGMRKTPAPGQPIKGQH